MYLAPHVTLSGRVVPMAGGLSGVRQTLRIMRSLVSEHRVNPSLRSVAVGAIFLTPPKNVASEICAVFQAVQSWIRYTRDVFDVETIASPLTTWNSRVGDCDDVSVLLATLLESVGYQTRFVVTGYAAPGILEHVYIEVLHPDTGEWMPLDATEKHSAGWEPPNPTTKYVENV